MPDVLSSIIALVGCFIGLAGWLAGRDRKIIGDAEWRGGVNSKLDTIHTDIGGVGADIKCLRDANAAHGERLTAVEESAKQAHKRIDRIEKGGGAN